MDMKNKLLCRKWKRWTALVMVVVMILLQPCTVLADAGIRRTETGAEKADVTESAEDIEKSSLETESEQKEEAILMGIQKKHRRKNYYQRWKRRCLQKRLPK